MWVSFEVVSLRQKVSYKCTGCGKSRVKAVCVEHTVNPFNRNADGFPKTRQEVYEDVKRVLGEHVATVRAGIKCSKCEAA